MRNVIYIEVGDKNGKAFLKKGYAAHPFKIADITEHRSCKALELMLMSSSPGILDGDQYQMHIHIGAQACLVFRTQAYQRLFAMKSAACQQLEVRVESGAAFTYLPHPVVPHAHAHFICKNRISLASSSQLTWGEVITCGRKLNGEAFLFTCFQSLTEIFYDGKLVVRDNLVMKPATTNLNSMGKLEGYTHQASLVLIDERIDSADLVNTIHQSLSSEEEICYGVTALVVNGVIIRILGNKAEQLFHLLQSIAERCVVFNPGHSNTSALTIEPAEYVG
jgi:urease accessory protein